MLDILIQANIPTVLWGDPGTGKTSAIRALAAQLRLHLETIIASIREPADIGGLPVITPHGVVLESPAWAKRLIAAERGVLFIDEISCSPPAVQAALLRVVLDRVVGDLQLPPGIVCLAAANPPESAAGGWELTAPLANRFCHLDWRLRSEDWCTGVIAGFSTVKPRLVPDNWRTFVREELRMISAFIKAQPMQLLKLPENEREAGRAWPSPRSWADLLAPTVGAARAIGADEDEIISLAAGCIGPTALNYFAWRRDLDLPDPRMILEDPKRLELTGRGDRDFAILNAITGLAIEDLKPETWRAAWQVLEEANRQGHRDTAAASVRALVQARNNSADKDKLTPQREQMRSFLPLLKAAELI